MVAAVQLGRGRHQLAVRARRHRVHRARRGRVPVGARSGSGGATRGGRGRCCGTILFLLGLLVINLATQSGVGTYDDHTVLGPHDPAPDADHDRPAAARRRPARDPAPARQQEPAAHRVKRLVRSPPGAVAEPGRRSAFVAYIATIVGPPHLTTS